MRAAQSKGKVDLLTLWPFDPQPFPDIPGMALVTPRVWLVQCKTGSARMSRADKEELVALARKAGATPVLAQPGKNGRGVQFINLELEEEIQH